MGHSLNIQLFKIVFAYFLIGIGKGSMLYGQSAQNQSNSTIIHTSKVDTSSSIIFIDSLKVGQRYFINEESNGCFHHSDLNLIIFKDKDGYFASFKMKAKIEGQKVTTKFKKNKLTNYQIDSVRNFERQLIYFSVSKYDCTTVVEYTLSIDTLKKVYIVDKCDWPGIGKLVGVLFPNTKSRPPRAQK